MLCHTKQQFAGQQRLHFTVVVASSVSDLVQHTKHFSPNILSKHSVGPH